MKKGFVLVCLTALLALPLGALASQTAMDCLLAACPEAAEVQLDEWGGTAAAVCYQDGQPVLCVMEKQAGAWRMVIRNETALLPQHPLPQVLVDSDDTLYWRYQTHQTITFASFRDWNGEWGAVSEIVQETSGDRDVLENRVYWNENGSITRTYCLYDENENPLCDGRSETFAAPWLAERIRLADFDVTAFPVFTFQEYDGQWPERAFVIDAAEALLPDYAFADGSLADGDWHFLVDRADGTRVFAGCSFDGETIRLAESAPLPEETFYGVENFTTSLGISRGSDLLCVTPADLTGEGNWGVRWLYAPGEMLTFGPRCLYAEDGRLAFGEHPWSDIAKADWNALPRSFEEAAKRLNADGWMVVRNPNPADRLHLRVGPDRTSKSLGKYYNGTPVRVLEQRGDWVRARIGETEGWMMKKYLVSASPLMLDVSAMPQLMLREASALLYEESLEQSNVDILLADEKILVTGIVGDEWYHVWLPLSDAYGYVKQSDLWPGNG